MKKQPIFLRTLIIVVSLIFFGCSDANKKESGWIFIGMDDSDSLYYDKGSLNHLSDGVGQVWIMSKLSEESVTERINERKILNLPIKGYDRSSYDLSLVELDCKKRTLKQMITEEYDDKGNKLDEYEGEMNIRIAPGSRGEIIFEKVCQK
jgi:hypothetical protein